MSRIYRLRTRDDAYRRRAGSTGRGAALARSRPGPLKIIERNLDIVSRGFL